VPDANMTKTVLAKSLKELLEKKSIHKISIAEITQHCGMNRQTFYYHFRDKYELVSWIYYYEIIRVATKDQTLHDWSDGIMRILTVMKNDIGFYQNALSITGRNSLEEYLFALSKDLILTMLETLTNSREIEPQYKKFIVEFYACGMVGLIKSWARAGMKQTPQTIKRYFNDLVKDSRKLAFQYYSRGKQKERHLPKQPTPPASFGGGIDSVRFW
jgi:probable dihydroxyacetone kinase regulator